MKHSVFVLCLFVCVVFLASPVQAIPISFNFSSGENLELSSLALQTEGLQLAVAAADAAGAAAVITQTQEGLGVYRGGSDAKALDGYGVDDLLLFSFSSAVRLISVSFSLVEAGDSFTLLVDGNQYFKAPLLTPYVDFVAGNFVGKLFVFSADEDRADYRIQQIIVDDLSAAPVPEPSSWMLLSLGVAGLAGFGRFRRNN